MKTGVGWLIFMLLLAMSCRNSPHAAAPVVNIKDTASKQIRYPDTPDFAAHIAPLLSYFERNKNRPAFDTSISFVDQGFGPIDNYYNFVIGGHIFSDTQTHALLFYDVAEKDYAPFARMIVYKKERGVWKLVLEDSTRVSDFRFRYKDWNCDGIRDLSYIENGWEHGGHGPVTWSLWLADKKGMLHNVKGFEELDDPRIDSFTHHIFTNTELHTSELLAEYKFSGNHIIKISADMEVDYEHPQEVAYLRDGKIIKKVKLKPGQQLYTPKYEGEGR